MAEIIAIDKKVIVMVREIAGNDTSKGPSYPGRIINLPLNSRERTLSSSMPIRYDFR